MRTAGFLIFNTDTFPGLAQGIGDPQVVISGAQTRAKGPTGEIGRNDLLLVTVTEGHARS